MPLEGIDAFEELNNLTINVYGVEDTKIIPIRTSVKEGARESIDLLLVEDGDSRHYALIKDLHKLLKPAAADKSAENSLPKKIANKEACINIDCPDDESFKWAIIAEKHRAEVDGHNRSRLAQYTQWQYEFSGHRYPMEPSDIRSFERRENISVNTFYITNGKDGSTIEPLVTSMFKPNDPNVVLHVDLLYHNNRYYLINNLSRLVSRQVSKNAHAHFVCRRCLHLCTTQEILDRHIERCVQHKAQAVKMPKATKNNPECTMHYYGVEKQLPLPFIFVADFESILKPIDTVLPEVPEPDVPVRDEDGQLRFSKFRNVGDPEHGLRPTSSTTKIHEHEACGFAYQIMSVDPRFYEPPVVVRGQNCAEEFLTRLQADAERIRGWLKHPEPMPELTPEEQVKYDNATHCHICGNEFDWLDEAIDGKPHRDHDHVTGVYRGAAHPRCNVNYRINPEKIEIPCFLHNLKGYDAHLIIKAAKKEHGKITAIPTNSEKYISFTIGDKLKKVTFKDSFAFMSSSLDSLVKDLKPEELVITRRYLEMEQIQKREDISDAASSIETEDLPNSDDMSFIDDDDDVPTDLHQIQRHYQFDDSDDEIMVSLLTIHQWV